MPHDLRIGEHFPEGGILQDLVGDIEERLGQALLQAGHNLLQEQIRIVVDDLVADLAQDGIAVEQIVQVDLLLADLDLHLQRIEAHMFHAVPHHLTATHAHVAVGVGCSGNIV